MTARILIVCTANICRSPLAERLLQAYVARYGPNAPLEVSSAGTSARPGHPAAPGMRTVAASWGLELEGHRSRRVDAELIRSSDLVITMEDRHRSAVSRLGAGIGQYTFTITELDALVSATDGAGGADGTDRDGAGVTGPGGLPGQVTRWHATRARTSIEAPDVTDPYGGPSEGYTQTAWELADLVERIGPALVAALDAEDRSEAG